MKLASVIAALALFGAMASAQASPVDVTYTVSGSSGNWTLDFSVTNNLGGTNGIYAFGVLVQSPTVSNYPVGWFSGGPGANWSLYGGSNTNYDATWLTCPVASCPANYQINNVLPGQTLSGFRVVDAEATAPALVSWYAVAAGGNYSGPGCSFICNAPFDNPGFEGTALAAAPVPVPAALWLFGSALSVMGAMRRKRPSQAAQSLRH